MKRELITKILFELIKNSKKSDRELARSLGLWQSTITRYRKKLEKEGIIQEYTVIPDLPKMGYEILAFVFVRVRGYQEWSQKMVEKLYDFSEVIFATRAEGMGWNGLVVSLHKNYTRFSEYYGKFLEFGKDIIETSEAVLVSLSTNALKPFSLKYLEKEHSFY